MNNYNERGNVLLFVIAMSLAIGVALIDKFNGHPQNMHITLPNGNEVVACDVFCLKNRFVVDLGSEQITIPPGYIFDKTGDSSGRFIIHTRTASAGL